MKKYVPLLLALVLAAALAGCGEVRGAVSAKPVLYLYPQEETTVSIQLDYNGGGDHRLHPAGLQRPAHHHLPRL